VTPKGATNSSSWSNDSDNGALSAVIYLRVSTKEQAEKGGEAEGYSIPAQREACKRKATSLGAVVVEEFVDRGESARSARRPELQRMLVYVKENPVAYVIVHKVDRLARNRADDVEINLALKAAGATLVSVSENIDETPSGILLHGIMSDIAEFYSRNLANEVIKGSTQKAKNGGTIGKAPLGYLNVRKTENGREVRTVEVDPARGPLMQWAFAAYATGDWTLRPLLEELTRRGLTAPPGRKTPEKSLELSHFHKLLRHPYYKGLVRYRGVEYQGKHEPLVSEATWERVQQALATKNQAGERHRVHHHYLKGSLFCGSCGSRMIITNARNRHGQVYPYFVCLGRHQKRTDCTFKAVLIETVEEKVIDHYGTVQLTSKVRDMIELGLGEDFAAFRQEITVERKVLDKNRKRLLAERAKLLQAHYADAVPLDLLKTEQTRIADQLAYIEQRFDSTDSHEAVIGFNLRRTLELATDVHEAYRASDPTQRRLLNQSFFKKLTIHDDGHIESELAEPYDILLSPTLRARAQAAVHLGEVAVPQEQPAEPDWKTLEASFNDSTHKDERLVGAGQTRRPPGRQGLNNEILVGAGGFEPP
jgi:site-specific DNA recombinase